MNFRYLLWLMSRQLRQPVSMLLIGVYGAIIAALALIISFEMSGQTIRSITVWKFTISEPGNFEAMMLPSLMFMLTFGAFFLFLLAAASSAEESLYHPMNAILLVTPLTRNRLYVASGLSAAILFTLLFALFAGILCLVIGMKTGLYYFPIFAEMAGWTALLYSASSALIIALMPVFKRSTPVFIIIMLIFTLSSYLPALHEWYFKALNIALPAIGAYEDAAINSLFHREETGGVILPLAVSIVYLFAGMAIYNRQDER